jgi:hypothetical protein
MHHRCANKIPLCCHGRNGHPTLRTGAGCASEANRFIAVFDNQTMPLPRQGLASFGDVGKAAEDSTPRRLCCLNFRMSNSVILCSPSQAAGRASHSFISALDRPPSGCVRRPRHLSPSGLFLLRDPHLKRKKPRRVKQCARAPICNGPYSLPIGGAKTTQKPVSVGLTARRSALP